MTPIAGGLTSGARVREYEVLGRICRAEGRGDLFACRHTLLGTAVALREIPPDLLTEAVTREWLLREAKVFAEFEHPSIAKVIGCFEEDGHTYLVYDFLDGILLEDVLKRGPLPPSQAVRIAVAVGRALETAHSYRWKLGESWERGIPHGDLRTGCVVLGGGDRVKIFDFSPIGSVRDPAGDRRALGRILAEMLMGTSTWNDEDYPQRLPPLPGSLREVLDSLILPGDGAPPPEFDEFLHILEDIAIAYEEGGLVPRAVLELPDAMGRPLPIACNAARKRIYVGDANSRLITEHSYAGECLEQVKSVGNRAAGLIFVPGYGLYVFGPGKGEVSLVTIHGGSPFSIDGWEAHPGAGALPHGELVATARLGRGKFLLADDDAPSVLVVDATGKVESSFGREGTEAGAFLAVSGLAASRNEIAVVDCRQKSVVFFDKEGNFRRRIDAGEDGLSFPVGCDFDPLGNLYVADRGGGRITIFEPGGGRVEFEDVVVDDRVILSPADIVIAEGGSLLAVSDPDERAVLVFDNYFFLAASERSGRCPDCGFQNPVGVARCLVCQELESVFPVVTVSEGSGDGDDGDDDLVLADTSSLEEEMMIESFIEAGESRKAIEPLRRRLKRNPRDEEAINLLADAYLACGETEPLSLLELLRKSSDDDVALRLLVCALIGLLAPGPAGKHLARLEKRLGADSEICVDLRERLDEIRDSVSRADNSRFFLRLAGLCEVENRVGDALDFYEHQLALDPQDYGTRSSTGKLLLREHRFEEAEPHYKWMLERNPYDVEALEVLSCLSNRRGDWQATVELLTGFFGDPQIGDRLIAGHGKLRYNLGLALREMGREDESKREMARARRLGFKPVSTEKIGSFFDYHKEGDFVRLVQVGEELCLEFELFRWPDAEISRSLLWKMASAYEQIGDPDRAVRCYRIFVEHFPTHPAAVAANSAIADIASRLSSENR